MRASAVSRHRPDVGSPGSRVRSFCTCQVLRPRRAVRALALTCPYVLPSAFGVGAQGMNLYEAQWLAYALPYRRFAAVFTDCDARSGPIWIATPSSYRTYIDCSLPVSRRTAKHSGHYSAQLRLSRFGAISRSWASICRHTSRRPTTGFPGGPATSARARSGSPGFILIQISPFEGSIDSQHPKDYLRFSSTCGCARK